MFKVDSGSRDVRPHPKRVLHDVESDGLTTASGIGHLRLRASGGFLMVIVG